MRRNTAVLFALLAILAVFALVGWVDWQYRQQQAGRGQTSAASAGLLPGSAGVASGDFLQLMNQPAPDFALGDLKGNKVTLADYRGKAVLVNFWATWCAPCKIETPWLIELRNQFAPQGFEVLGIDTEGDNLAAHDTAGWAKDKKAVGKFAAEMQVPYPVLMGGDSISRPYGGLDDLPMSFYVDRKGTVVSVQVGLSSKNEMEAMIRKALGEE